jgi:hypothetical protein
MKMKKSSAIAILLGFGIAFGCPVASFAQDKDAAKVPGPLPRKDAAKTGAATKAPPPGMDVRTAVTMTMRLRYGRDFFSGSIALSSTCTMEASRASSILAIPNCLARSSNTVS